jgi:hypothetical protein
VQSGEILIAPIVADGHHLLIRTSELRDLPVVEVMDPQSDPNTVRHALTSLKLW